MRIKRSAALPLRPGNLMNKFIAVLASALLATSLIPVGSVRSAYASPTSDSGNDWVANIDEMLEGKDYVEGDAIVIIATSNSQALASVNEDGNSASVDVLGGCEELFTTSTATAATAIDAAEVNNAVSASEEADGNSEAAATDNDSDIAIVLAHQDGMTTREMLETLANDPRVVDASPNYVGTIQADGSVTADTATNDSTSTNNELSVAGSAPENTDSASNTASIGQSGNNDGVASDNGNLSESAGGNDADSSNDAKSNTDANAAAAQGDAGTSTFQPAETTQISAEDTPDMTDYQWANQYDSSSSVLKFDTDSPIDANIPNWNAGTENAAGVVAVVDTGVDYTHPDLQNVMFDMTDYMDTVGGGKYGYNGASISSNPETDPMDLQDHGTHCAGIIAAESNGTGTTGAANGVKLLACRTACDNGGLLTSDIIKCYSYLSRAIDAGVDIRAINNSWGGNSASSYALVVTELGQKGAISVIASGNSSQDNDTLAVTSLFASSNPYAVVVNSSSMAGQPSSFSCYGKESTNFYSPGSTIMSSIPQSDSKYLPSFVEESQNNSNAAYDTFDGTGSIEVYLGYGEDAIKDENRVTTDGGDNHYDESGSICITGKQLKATESSDRKPTSSMKHRYSVTFKIPVTKDKLGSISNFGAAFNSNTKAKCAGVAAIEVQSADGSIVNYTDIKQLSGFSSMYGWNNLSESFSKAISNGGDSLKDASLVWHSDGTVNGDGQENGYVIVPMEIVLVAASASEVTDDDLFYIDCVGLGNSTLPYELMCGTSMATPLATGAAAICSTAVDQSQDASTRAKQTAQVLKSCTTQYDQFSGKCTQNGTLDLSKLSETAAASPVVSEATLAEDSDSGESFIDITGASFRSAEGTVTVDSATAEIISWSDSAIRVKTPNGMLSGKHEITVTNANGSSLKAFVLRFTKNIPDGDVALYDETISVDDQELSSNTSEVTLIGLNDYIYFFQDNQTPSDPTSANTIKSLYRYSTKTGEWESLGDLPTYTDPVAGKEVTGFISVSVTLWEGKILMLGRGGSSQCYTQHLYQYDPDTNEWTQLPDIEKNIPIGAAIVNADGTMVALGGTARELDDSKDRETSDADNNIWKIDMETGERTLLGSLTYPRSNWTRMYSKQLQVAASGDTIYVTGGVRVRENSYAEINQPAERLVKQSDGTYKSESVAEYLPATESIYDDTFGLAAGSNGAVFCGLKVKEGNQDTYELGNNSSTASAFGKKLSDLSLGRITALAYHGKLYAFGSDEFNGGFSLMRATAFETPEHPAGELADEPLASYTVKFDTAGGSAVDSQTITQGEKATKPADPTLEGFTFEYWADADGKEYDFDTPVTSDLTLHAVWSAVDKPVPVDPDPTPDPTPDPSPDPTPDPTPDDPDNVDPDVTPDDADNGSNASDDANQASDTEVAANPDSSNGLAQTGDRSPAAALPIAAAAIAAFAVIAFASRRIRKIGR